METSTCRPIMKTAVTGPPDPAQTVPSCKKDVFTNSRINYKKEITLTYAGLLVTLLGIIMTFKIIVVFFLNGSAEHNFRTISEQVLFAVFISGLIYGNVLYQFTRIGYMRRLLNHVRRNDEDFDNFFTRDNFPALTILIPSYKEEIRVVKQAVMASALQDYPSKRVVLLIDDPAHPARKEDRIALQNARHVSHEIKELLAAPFQMLQNELSQFESRIAMNPPDIFFESLNLATLYSKISEWFRNQARRYPVQDHTDELFVKLVFLDNADKYKKKSEKLEQRILDGRPLGHVEDYYVALKRLIGQFDTEISSFERKRYENLSHEPNKAMNLNSYISLLGKNWGEVWKNNKLHLKETHEGPARYSIPDTDFLITLDADSLLTSDYAMRLIDVMTSPGQERLAIIQTPYSAIPHPSGLLERVAGATTDMQYNIHQGFGAFQSTFWVGANALLRKKALNDICVETEERGYKVKIFIQDRTVIEDTESSIDLVAKGWNLFNYPERLSYSATPPDFGSLLIQRRRWANGGLIILPKLLRYLINPLRISKTGEAFMRIHYLGSVSMVNVGLLVLLFYPFNDNINNLWLPLTALPYFVFYGRDLLQARYRFMDLFRVYALNLLLIPINLGGVFKSIHQALTGRKIPFKRTPKISGRTRSPVFYLICEYFLLFYFFLGSGIDFTAGRYAHSAFSFVNAVFFFYAIVTFIGVKETFADLKNSRHKKIEPDTSLPPEPCFYNFGREIFTKL